MIRSFARLRYLLLPLGVFALTACGVVGKGNAPVSLQIESPGNSLGASAIRAYQCVSDQLAAVLTFADGTTGNFTNRVTWSSSNPSVVYVDASTGVLSPEAPGTATITATYDTLNATITVAVSALTSADLSLQTLDENTYSPIGPGGFTIATNTSVAGRGTAPATQEVALVANEGTGAPGTSVMRNLTSSATFALTDSTGAAVPASTVATSSSATAYSLTPGSTPSPGSYTLTATLGACNLPQPPTVSVPLTVANVSSLTLQPELNPVGGPALGFADSNGNPLPLMQGYGVERLGLIAHFANGQTQDVSLSGQYTSSVPTVAAFDFASLNPGDFVNILTALHSSSGAGSVTDVSASFFDGTDVAGGPGIVSNTLAFTASYGTLNSASLSVLPSSGTVNATSTVDSSRFHAIGNFTVSGSPTLVQQDVSRLSTFTSSNTNLATVETTPSVDSGLAVPANVNTASDTSGGLVNISASLVTSGGTQTIYAPSAVLTVNPQPDAP